MSLQILRLVVAECTARDELLNKLVDRNGFGGRRNWRWRERLHTVDGNDDNEGDLMCWFCNFVSIVSALRGRELSSRWFTCDKNPSV